jgi:hypothetical protein
MAATVEESTPPDMATAIVLLGADMLFQYLANGRGMANRLNSVWEGCAKGLAALSLAAMPAEV